MTWQPGIACWLVFLSVSTLALEPTLDRRALEQAILIGQSRSDAERARFHATYRIKVSRVPVDWIDVLTPFHRVAVAAGRARAGGRVFGQREAQAALDESPDLLELIVELTFHPQNTYVGVPAYDVVLSNSQGVRVKPRGIARYPRFTPRVESGGPALPNPHASPILSKGQPVIGGTISVQFGVADVDPSGRYEIIVSEKNSEVARVAMDLAKMR